MVIITLTTEVEQLQRYAGDMLTEACKHDSVDPKSTYIVFTPDNPYLEEYDLVMARLRRLQLRCLQ